MKLKYILICAASLLLISCNLGQLAQLAEEAEAAEKVDPNTIGFDTSLCLMEAREHFQTGLLKKIRSEDSIEAPPIAELSLITYPGELGNMPAYLSKIPQDGKKHPAIIWIVGGFGNGVDRCWEPQDEENDQSAAVFWKSGIVTMYPAMRGGGKNVPGYDESGFGEVDDIIAAAKYLRKLPGIDAERIYLGGHSTGGTKVLLAAESFPYFRSTFSWGPVIAFHLYGEEGTNFDTIKEKEYAIRAPYLWLKCLRNPVYIMEGDIEANGDQVRFLDSVAKAENNHFLHAHTFTNGDHFNYLSPLNSMIAKKILADTIPGKQINISTKELNELKIRE